MYHFLFFYANMIVNKNEVLNKVKLKVNERMKNSKDLILGDVVNISIIYRIPDSWLYSLNDYDF